MKKLLLILLIFTNIYIYIYSQQAEFVEKISNLNEIRFADFVQLFLLMKNEKPDSANYETNLELMKKYINYDFSKYIKMDTIVDSGIFSSIILSSWKYKGGIFYSLTKNRLNKLYSTKEFSYLGIYPKKSPYNHKLSGIEILNLLNKVGEYEKKVILFF